MCVSNDKKINEPPSTKNVIMIKCDRQGWMMAIVYVNIVLYALCYQLQRPIEPFLVDRFATKEGVEEGDVLLSYGRLQSFFSLLQAFGSPVVGVLLDRIGAKNCFVFVFLSSACSYFLLANANSITGLYLSKIPSIFQAAFLVAQALIATNLSDGNASSSSRAAALGRLTTAYTIGASVGPALGGMIGASGDYFFGAKLAATGSLISAALAAFALPDLRTENIRGDEKEPKTSSPIMVGWSIISRPTIWPLLLLKVTSSISNSMLNTALPIFLKQRGFNESAMGWNMSASFVVVAITGAFVVKPLTKMLGPARITWFCLVLKGFVAILLGLVSEKENVIFVAMCSISAACLSHLLATSLTTRTTGAVEYHEQGTLLGIEHSLFSGARIFGPGIGMKLMSFGGFFGVAITCCSIDVALGITARLFRSKKVD